MPDLDRRVVESVRRIPGVVRADSLDDRDRGSLLRLATPMSAVNDGMAAVLSRGHVVCLFKDATFRPPPEPTLLLVDDRGSVLGKELIPGDTPPEGSGRRFAFLGKDFVLFGDTKPQGRLRFSLPPVRFPELERLPGVEAVVSASPDTPQDEYLRERLRVPQGRELASILIGYNRRNA